MVNLKIDHNEISVPEGTTIMEAAALAQSYSLGTLLLACA